MRVDLTEDEQFISSSRIFEYNADLEEFEMGQNMRRILLLLLFH